jgi:hypothetical protein
MLLRDPGSCVSQLVGYHLNAYAPLCQERRKSVPQVMESDVPFNAGFLQRSSHPWLLVARGPRGTIRLPEQSEASCADA